MTLIEGIGDEVTQFFFALLIIAIVSVGWWTTSTSEQRHVQTVWLLDRRRHRSQRRLTNHTHTVTITEGTSTVESPPSSSTPTSASFKPPEAGTSTDEARDEASGSRENSEASMSLSVGISEEENERSSILATMDADAFQLRQRRVAFYDRTTPESSTESLIQEDTTIMEHNLAERQDEKEAEKDKPQISSSPQTEGPPEDPTDLRIRLKYINDDLRLVDGKLQEKLEDFKKRHFQAEISSNKFVRLIFNGQVLQPESKTLQSCGLFDNCVVHCLIHQRRPLNGDEVTSDVRTDAGGGTQRSAHLNNNNHQGRDWDLGNFLFAMISFTLLSAWYFRYVYAHLYTVTATGGLIVMTGLFTIILFGFYFPDPEHMVPPPIPPRMDNSAQAQS